MATLCLVVGLSGAAQASWRAGGTGSASAKAQSLAAPAAPSVSKSGRNVTVSWSQVSIGGSYVGSLSGGGYLVTRYPKGSTSGVTPGSACNALISGAAATLSCTESSVPTGQWVYTVRPALGQWRGPNSPAGPVVSIPPNAPTSVTLTNGGGQGNAYINSSNASSLSFNVAAPATSLSTDTVTLTLTDGVNTVSRTAQPSVNGATTVSFTGVNASALLDGTITVRATSTSSYGDVSPTASTSVTKDTVAPAAPVTVALANGGGQGSTYINSGNQASINVSVSVVGGLASDTIKVVASDAGNAHTATGTVASPVGAGTVTVTGMNLSSLNDGTVTFTATVTDLAGNVSATKTATATKDTVAAAIPAAKLSAKDNTGVVADTITGLAGAAEAGATVKLTETTPRASVYTAVAGSDGSFNAQVDAVNGAGAGTTVTYSIVQTDVAGNTSTAITFSYSDKR